MAGFLLGITSGTDPELTNASLLAQLAAKCNLIRFVYLP
jgi:hypothetical protein